MRFKDFSVETIPYPAPFTVRGNDQKLTMATNGNVPLAGNNCSPFYSFRDEPLRAPALKLSDGFVHIVKHMRPVDHISRGGLYSALTRMVHHYRVV